MDIEDAAPCKQITWDEVRALYPDQWVVLADIAWINANDFAFTSAAIVGAFAERKAASTTIKDLHAAKRRGVGCFFTGEPINGDFDPLWLVRKLTFTPAGTPRAR